MGGFEAWPPGSSSLEDPRDGYVDAWFLREETRAGIRKDILNDLEKEVNKHLLDQ